MKLKCNYYYYDVYQCQLLLLLLLRLIGSKWGGNIGRSNLPVVYRGWAGVDVKGGGENNDESGDE